MNREDIKEFSKVKEPLLGYLKGEFKTEPILKSGKSLRECEQKNKIEKVKYFF